MKNRQILVLFLLCSIALAASVEAKTQSSELKQLLQESDLETLDKKAADFTLPDPEGNSISLADYRGKVVLLNFWASWCPNCAEERPFLEKLHQKFKDEDFVLLAVNEKENNYLVKRFIKKYNLTFLNLLDKQGKVSEKYNVFFLPVSFIIDKEGWIVSKVIGLRDWTAKPMTDLFEYLIKQ